MCEHLCNGATSKLEHLYILPEMEKLTSAKCGMSVQLFYTESSCKGRTMSDKLKKSTGGKLLLRSGGLALSLPIVLGLGGVLMLVNSLLAVIIIGGLLTGDSTVAPYLSILGAVLALGVFAMAVLFRGVFRYTGGIGKLWSRLRGIQDERDRVGRLIDNQTTQTDANIEFGDDSEQNTLTNHQKRK